MKKSITLVSVQPLVKSDNVTKQWPYYEKMITDYISRHQLSSENDNPVIVTLPEYALGNGRKIKEINLYKEKVSQINGLISEFTKKNNVILFAGSYSHLEKLYSQNRLHVWDNKGKLIATYNKKRLFNFEKRNNFRPGNESGLLSLNNLKVKILLCSDLWFPEELRSHSHQGLNLVIVPAMSVVPKENRIAYGRWLWHSLAITRARENVVPVVVSDWGVQKVPDGQAWTCGASSIIDPSIRWTNNDEYKQAFNHFENGKEGIISSTIDMEKIREYKNYRREVGLLPKEP